jgi:hypothetical protein
MPYHYLTMEVSMRSLSLFLLFLGFGLFIIRCDNSSTGSKEDLELDQVVEEQALVGWEINETVTVGNDIQELTQTSELFEDPALEEFTGTMVLKKQINRMYGEAREHLKTHSLQKVTEDSIIFDTTRPGWGGSTVRTALYFYQESGQLRYFEVRYNFGEQHNLQYDSSEVVINVGENWLFPSQEQIVHLYRYQEFREDFFVQSIESRVEATEYDGNEITGVEITVDSYYHPDRRLVHRRELVQFNADESGTLRTEHDYSDGTTTVMEVTFSNDGTGTFTRERRDGTVVTGSFNSVEDDLQGFYSELVDFPEGRYVDRILREAAVAIELPDSVFKAWFKQVIYFDSGSIDSSAAALQVEEIEGLKTTTLNRTRHNGAFGSFVIQEREEEAALTGYWVTWDSYYIDVNAEYYLDGSGHLHYEVYASEEAFNNGEDPIIVVDYFFAPDQSGTGTLTHNGRTYDVVFNADGTAVIEQGSKSRSLNVY